MGGESDTRREFRASPTVVGLVALTLVGMFVLRLLSAAEMDPTVFVGFGEAAPVITAHGEAMLGRDVPERVGLGHDGQWYLLQSFDPWLLAPDVHARLMPTPVYRSQRMLYPVIASLGGLVPVHGLAWSLLVTNVVAVGVGTAAIARIAVAHGRSAWWGLAFPINVGLLAELANDGAGILAFALAAWGIVYYSEQRFAASAAWLAAAVLVREVMLLTVIGLMVLRWLTHRQIIWRLAAPSVGAAVAWAVYVRVRLDPFAGLDEEDAITWPLRGLFEAFPSWLTRPQDLAAAGVVLVLLIVFTARTLKTRHPVAWGTLGYVLVTLILTDLVWRRSFDITRAVAPSITGFVMLAFVVDRSATRSSPH